MAPSGMCKFINTEFVWEFYFVKTAASRAVPLRMSVKTASTVPCFDNC